MGVGTGLYMCDVVKKFTFAISSPDEFLSILAFSILVKCPGLYLKFPYLCFLILAILAHLKTTCFGLHYCRWKFRYIFNHF